MAGKSSDGVSFAEKILCPELLHPMVKDRIISEIQCTELLNEEIPKSSRRNHLLRILATIPSEKLHGHCETLRRNGLDQLQLADLLAMEGADRRNAMRGVTTESYREQLRLAIGSLGAKSAKGKMEIRAEEEKLAQNQLQQEIQIEQHKLVQSQIRQSTIPERYEHETGWSGRSSHGIKSGRSSHGTS